MATRKPKSPIDDVVKWLAKEARGTKGFSPADVKKIKRFARGIGYNDVYEKKVAPVIAKKAKMPTSKKKVPDRVARHLEFMSDKRQDKKARVFGDYPNPHEYFGVGGRAPTRSTQRELNKKFDAAWKEEQAIGRANARKARQGSQLNNYKSSKPTKKQAAARKAAQERSKKK
jgi:hypothetical protein